MLKLYAIFATVDKELDHLQQAGVIQPVNYSSWANLIIVLKRANGKICLCSDYSTVLNEVVTSHQYSKPVPEDIFTKLNGDTCFVKLHLADAYLQMRVDSKEL